LLAVDGNFLHECVRHRIDAKEKFAAIFHGPVNPSLCCTFLWIIIFSPFHYLGIAEVTECIFTELRALGEPVAGTRLAAKRFHRLNCKHDPAVSPPECILKMTQPQKGLFWICHSIFHTLFLGNFFSAQIHKYTHTHVLFLHNTESASGPRYCVATQDEALRAKLREAGHVPLLYVDANSILLESPPRFVKDKVFEVFSFRFMLCNTDCEMILTKCFFLQEETKFGGLTKAERRALSQAKFGTSTKPK
jgi:rRNA-processing protein FCF1